MKTVKAHIESLFEAIARFLFHHRLKALLALALFFAATVSHLPDITIDTSTEGFLHENDPALQAYNQFRDQFGRDEMILVGIKAPEIFDPLFLKNLQQLHTELREQVPYIEDITSLINARETRGQEDQLIVGDLLEDWPENPAELAALRVRAINNPLYTNLLISEDSGFTAIIMQTQTYTGTGQDLDVLAGFEDQSLEMASEPRERTYLTDAENSEAVQAVKRVAAAYQAPGFHISIAGSPVVTDSLKRNMMHDMRTFLALALLTIGIFLFVMFRRASGVFLPLLVVALSLLSTVGLMAAWGTAIKLPTQILPSFLLAVGVGAAVHILAIFFHELRHNQKDKEAALIFAYGHSGLAILMTSLTTASGLLSFSTAEIAPIADLGIFAGVGVLLSFVYTLIVLPPLVSLMPLAMPTSGEHSGKRLLTDRLLSRVGRFSTSRPLCILIVSGMIMALSIPGITRIRFSHDILKWFPRESRVRQDTQIIDRELNGSIALELILNTDRTNGLYDPDLLQRLDRSSALIERLKTDEVFAGKAWTITTILKEIHQALNENKQAAYAVPDDPRLIAQEFLLFENSGSDDLEDVTDSQFSKARFTIKVPFRDAVVYKPFIQKVTEHFRKTYPDIGLTTTGMTVLLFQTVTKAIHSMARSYLLALVVITLLMILLIGKLRIGVLSMVPNLFPILLTLGIMGWFEIPMDLFTMLVGSIAIGLAVDDTVHFMHNFRRAFEEHKDAVQAVHTTLQTTGRAMLITTCVLSAGFFIFLFADMNNLFNFGWLTGLTIITALLADYFLAPALMVLQKTSPDQIRTTPNGLCP